MFRIGILGSDNTHALHFAKLCNLPDENGNYIYDDVRVTALYGRDDDPQHTKTVAEQGGVEFIAQTPEEFIGKVDAVMVVNRKGSLHVPEILPFIEQGYPVWIDKPIATSMKDVAILKEACEKNNTLITGGSTIKYNYDVLTMKNRIDSGFFGELLGGAMNFPGDLESPYDGIYFYTSHLVEMMFTIFGYDVKSILATEVKHNRFTAIAKYENFQVALNFLPAGDYYMTVYGADRSLTTQMDISIIYKLGFEQFVKMLRTQKMPLSFDDLVKPVAVIDAIERSIKEKREIIL